MGEQAAQVMDEVGTVKPGWTLVKRVLRETLFKHQLHQDTEPFDKAYCYIRQYY